MNKRYFGTDGVRGTTNQFPITAETALRLGMAAARHFRREEGRRHSVVIGKDTRLSGYMIESALVAGFTSAGMDVFQFGPLPTPGVATLTRSLRADMGVMITASHNPYEDNGIKLFGPDGFKLSDEAELEIESFMDGDMSEGLAAPADLGRAQRVDDCQARYTEIVKATFPRQMRLSGLRIVVDSANGAAYKVAPNVLWELGADLIPINSEPNGFNINEDCGAVSPSGLAENVLRYRADIGIALDGDADRLIICDETGHVIDGDQLIALLAREWKRAGLLATDSVVTTQMSNLGLEQFLETEGLTLDRTQVGDRYVVERMRESGANLGGEQSGHIVLSDYATTGDGLIAALQVLSLLVQSDKPASQLLRVFKPAPQLLKNVRYEPGTAPMERDSVKSAIEAAEAKLGEKGRILVRKSGTEPLVRVMAEGDRKLITEAVDAIVNALKA
ncbi:phosphoglucosamine mutase [Marinicauda pacifica]|jgi:phosphoglucosamine mutase|uniref:Phosphoglucosamine mutase n=1 Tax=Marinicauda pacifica TaxID=1133559 RepID=A0A4V3RYX3_9PROT|nr:MULTISPECIES: phosphoglucosamine mutase [Marinicauda]TGY92069.1 phosphoglucosamine mutase [Marinicauda pacifica]GGE45727.1 phosphoglucosamine mutase [Marinicauda pacifica]